MLFTPLILFPIRAQESYDIVPESIAVHLLQVIRYRVCSFVLLPGKNDESGELLLVRHILFCTDIQWHGNSPLPKEGNERLGESLRITLLKLRANICCNFLICSCCIYEFSYQSFLYFLPSRILDILFSFHARKPTPFPISRNINIWPS